MKVVEVIDAWGHRNITARNRSTFEITKERWLTRKGDCIIAVGASKGAADLGEDFKRAARREGAKISVIIEVDSFRESAMGYGDPDLSFKHPTDLVARKSRYVCGRTLMVKSDKAACDFSRDIIRAVQDPTKRIKITLIAES